ncbi:MAG: hypothetical protein AAFU85_07470 [Planctomycetota bacterium]
MKNPATSEFQAIRAPREDGRATIVPELAMADTLLKNNVANAGSLPDGLASLRAPARGQLLSDANRYSSSYRGGVEQPDESWIVMAGHQPTLFHSGVWFKNFALAHVGQRLGATSVNLVIDSDVSGARSIRVPHRDGERIHYETVVYDRGGQGVPFEQTLIEERERFDSFDISVRRALAGLVDAPIVGPLWKHAREAIDRCGYAGCAIAQARHAFEAEIGLQTVEIPQSVICRSQCFADFALQILRDAPRFRSSYNSAADTFRAANGIRSNAHPVPNLGRDGDWYETPFWLYGNQSPKRRSVWVRRAGSSIEISDRVRRTRRIENVESQGAVDALASAVSPEFKLRSRALITTMYARLILSDLFLHGIGGGKYDELGGQIAADFWGIQPPEFMVLSATVHLPGANDHSPQAILSSLSDAHRKRRDLIYQPERFEGARPEWVAQKRALLAAMPPRGQRKQWHRSINQLNQRLSSELSDVGRVIDHRIDELESEYRESLIWSSREHSFCLFPLEHLTESFHSMLALGEETIA